MIGILTFHASHNYGSMLQAYALQTVLLDWGYDCKIINFRSDRQRIIYPEPGKFPQNKRWKRPFLFLLDLPYLSSLKKKYFYFEDFLQKELNLTPEYATLEEIEKDIHQFDILISGSDQIWNLSCQDFDWAYFLPFTNKIKKIAYAPSIGPNVKKIIENKGISIAQDYIRQYDCISAREMGTADFIKQISGKNAEVVLDPTALVHKDHWLKFISPDPIVKEEYIFLYAPGYNKDICESAKKLSEVLNIKVVVSLPPDYKYFYPSFIYKCDVGPKEFLNLLYNARVVISGSFHAVLFSIYFSKPFYAINGNKDNRISNILSKLGLENRGVDGTQIEGSIKYIDNIDFSEVDKLFEIEKESSFDFLRQSLS
ncbi:MAG: Polysaccharide pyruvyl transferase [Bacteroidetes bacterium]|nr:Polysaccharide pyruvyl transferase [Bacteroidota bacterium]